MGSVAVQKAKTHQVVDGGGLFVVVHPSGKKV